MSDVWRWYTKARRFPALIGKDASGRRIPGGPYTVLQIIACPVTAALLWSTQGLWGSSMSGLARVVIVIAGTVGAVKLLGKVDFASRNPIYLTAAYAAQAMGSLGGRVGGTWVRPPRPSKVRSSVAVATQRSADSAPTRATTTTAGSALAEASQAETAPITSPLDGATVAGRAPAATSPATVALTSAARATVEGASARRPAPRSYQGRAAQPAGPTAPASTTAPASATTAPVSTTTAPATSTSPAATKAPSTRVSPRRSGLEAFLAGSSQKDAA